MTLHLLARPWRVAVAAALAAALAGCASTQIGSFVERGADLRQYRTYQWGPGDAVPTGDPRLDSNPFFDARMREQVDTQMSARGFEKTTAGTPDLLVHYHAVVTQRIDARDLDRGSGYCDEGDCQPMVYDEGTLVIDLVNARTGTLVWRGWAEESFDGVLDRQAGMEARVDAVVADIMKRLPL